MSQELYVPTVARPRRRPRALVAPRPLRHPYVPAFAVVAVAVALVGTGWAHGFGGGGFGTALARLRLVEVGPVSVIVLATILVIERLRPAQRRPLVARGHRQDALYLVFTVAVVAPLVTALGLSLSTVVRTWAPWLVLPHSGMVPRWCAIAVIFVVMDACNWLAHLANHRVRVLWRFHELHHSQEDMSVLTVFRTHPLIHVSYLVALVPAIALVRNGALSTTLLVVYASVTAFAHSNTNLGFGPLERIVVSPNFHRIHHRLDGAQDVNLGFVFTVWDQLARRAVFPTAATVRIDTGLPGRPLAVEQAGVRPRHLATFGAQLVGPFRPMADGPGEWPTAWVRRLAVNVLGAASAAWFALASLRVFLAGHRPLAAGFFLAQFTVVIAYLARRPAEQVSRRATDWALAAGGTFGVALLRPGGAHPAWGAPLGLGLQAVGLLVAVTGLLALGRSFGFAAARRPLVRRGPYRVVRHPVYAAYVLVHAGYLVQSASWWNAAVVACVTACNAGRAVAEDRMLSAVAEHAAYRQRVRWRLVPGLW